MKRVVLAAGLVGIWLLSAVALPAAPCTCATAMQTNGWCEAHGVGYVAMVRIQSRLLYDTLDAHGHTLDLGTFRCDSCRKAIDTDGFCEQDRNGFVDGQVYFSRLTYELARGEVRNPARIVCAVCKKNVQGHGWCDTCKIGMVGRVAVKDRQSYQHVSKAIDILEAANRVVARCEHCAVAIVTDTQCPVCRITYKGGRPLRP